jgi:NAD(P)-dependent dehydrogenase (short-subunit alcohol dehydrogenase family)
MQAGLPCLENQLNRRGDPEKAARIFTIGEGACSCTKGLASLEKQEERSLSELRFDDRVAVITGGGRGLGRAYALLLGARGAKVVVNDPGAAIKGEGTDSGPAEEVARAIRDAGGEAIADTHSVATAEGGAAIIQAALDAYGRIDILIHNAGNVRYGALKDLSYEDFDAVLDVHLRGAFHVVRPAFPLMCAAGYGRIVLTSSVGGLYGNKNVVNYGVSKAGLIGLANVAALEGQAEGVKCNVIVPSAVTRMADGLDTSKYPPLGPELVAPAVAWLCHETCSVTGEMLIAIGGRMARAYVAESVGLYQPEWSIEDVARHIDVIRDTSKSVIFPVVPAGQGAHIGYSFAMTKGTDAA